MILVFTCIHAQLGQRNALRASTVYSLRLPADNTGTATLTMVNVNVHRAGGELIV